MIGAQFILLCAIVCLLPFVFVGCAVFVDRLMEALEPKLGLAFSLAISLSLVSGVLFIVAAAIVFGGAELWLM